MILIIMPLENIYKNIYNTEYRDPCKRTKNLLSGPQPYIHNKVQGPMPKNKQLALWTTALYL